MQRVAQNLEAMNLNAEPTVEFQMKNSLLMELIDAPTVDPDILKRINQYLERDDANGTRRGKFLETWLAFYASEKIPAFARLAQKAYDMVAHYDYLNFEDFLNMRKTDVESRTDFHSTIKNLRKEFLASDGLHKTVLEKFLSLLIAETFMPINLLVIYNYACTLPIDSLRCWILEQVYLLELVGYDEDIDKAIAQHLRI
ncbi:Protein CBG05045 [Caenorhabditis briggsae]|uniref:Protein CBG05045 n=2 Tax=Caenorhabditis briggsae TaxID=6238 RepID=A8WZ20_CAEBR|nr:Protein CBG05045 [Caenorhabditis briggsae]ULT82742.1 hypothetical protein L3Y34_012170 [Caenorhabditis briggsae]CAP25629.1 Protein CBG05045 [Caenorhabditis briggsae]